MKRKLTITIDDDVYEGLHRKIGRRRISRFIETLARPHILDDELEAAYRTMAEDERRESEAEEWSEGTLVDVADASR